MSDVVTDLARRLALLESTAVRYRAGEVTDASPLSVALGGSDVAFTDVKTLDGASFAPGDVVAVLAWRGDLIVLGVIA